MSDARDWGAVAEYWRRVRPQRLWRTHADAVTRRLCARWWPQAPVRAVLKTDLFDEAFSEGLTAWLRARSRSAIGIDVTPAVAREAAARPRALTAAVADVRRLPFATEAFDVIVSNSTLDHFQDSADIVVALRELHRVLRRGGVLILTLDNPANPVVALRNWLPLSIVRGLGLVPYSVGQTMGSGELVRQLAAMRFAIDEVTSVLHAPRAPAVAAAAICDRAGAGARRVFLRGAAMCEGLQRLPTRRWTGYFTAIRARRLP